jgi:hypothetical protein
MAVTLTILIIIGIMFCGLYEFRCFLKANMLKHYKGMANQKHKDTIARKKNEKLEKELDELLKASALPDEMEPYDNGALSL